MQYVKLSDAFDLQMGKTPARDETSYWGGNNTWVSIADIGKTGKYIGESKETITDSAVAESGIKSVPKNTVIMSFKLTIGKTAITEKDLYTNEAIMAFRDKGIYDIDSNYLYHLLKCFNWSLATNKAAMGLTLNKTTLSDTKIPVPNVDTQRKIATILDKLDELIDNANLQIAKLDELVKAKFVEMFGDPTLNTKKLGVVKLKDIANYYNGLTYKPENVSDDGTIVLRSGNIQNGHLDFNDIVRVNSEIKEKYFVQNNDVLMCSRNGSARLVGKVALIENLPEKMSFGAFMMIIRSEYYPYLLTYFQVEDFRRQIRTGATTTVNQITVNMLDKICLPLPEKTQIKKYAEYVIQIKAIQNNISVKLKKLETLKQSLMQEYFG